MSIIDATYKFITNEGEERSCDDISDKACTNVPGNFWKNIWNGGFTKLAEQLISP